MQNITVKQDLFLVLRCRIKGTKPEHPAVLNVTWVTRWSVCANNVPRFHAHPSSQLICLLLSGPNDKTCIEWEVWNHCWCLCNQEQPFILRQVYTSGEWKFVWSPQKSNSSGLSKWLHWEHRTSSTVIMIYMLCKHIHKPENRGT